MLFVPLLLPACRPGQHGGTLPYLGSREPVERVVDGRTVVDTSYQQAPEFELLNQDSVKITEQEFEGSMYIVDFFFTSCPTICPTMSRNMLKIYKKFKDDPRVHFLSHTIDTKYDTPSILKAYADKMGVQGEQWQFVTGRQEEIYSLAPKYMVLRPEADENEPGGFIHQGWFILVDHNRHFRGAYDGTNDEQVAALMEDMDRLLLEIEYDQKQP